jgi:hypothetical protein
MLLNYLGNHLTPVNKLVVNLVFFFVSIKTGALHDGTSENPPNASKCRSEIIYGSKTAWRFSHFPSWQSFSL